MTPGKGSKNREFYDLSGRITCMIGGTWITAAREVVHMSAIAITVTVRTTAIKIG